jgi:hypothetical protein
MKKFELTLKAIVLTTVLPIWLYVMYHGVILGKFSLFNLGGVIN